MGEQKLVDGAQERVRSIANRPENVTSSHSPTKKSCCGQRTHQGPSDI